jgi:hypothetical protein
MNGVVAALEAVMDFGKEDAASQGIRLEVVKLPDAKRGFILHPRRWKGR